MGVYIGSTFNDYSAMRGPCPIGFHVPLDSEWLAVHNAGVALGAWTSSGGGSGGANLGKYLKICCPQYIKADGTVYSGTYQYAYLWCSNTNGSGYAYFLQFRSASITVPNSTGAWAIGCNIRPFRDRPIVPDSSWTTLYAGTGNAGIFHKPDWEVISISSDGTTRYTISDKNLGATKVWNDGDTITAENYGKFYQWGNNYGFPRGGMTTSSTTVNASDYGPGNYYSSSIFITTNMWDSSSNRNLRGGTTGVVQGAYNLWHKYIGEYVPPIFDWLLVGGGGAGGRARSAAGGGGGAGGVVYCECDTSLSGRYSIIIGAGGVGSCACYLAADGAGKDSCFGDVVAYGGGGGGGQCSASVGCVGGNGGSGGGGPGCSSCAGGTGCSGQGNAGGHGAGAGGGGGGVCSAGCNATAVCQPGAGGNGCEMWGICYGAGGGGGGHCSSKGAGGACGGGTGGCYRQNGANATSYGSGGGGAGYTASSSCCRCGGCGCAGVFAIGYDADKGYNVTGGNCCYLCDGKCIHVFTSDGTLTIN